MLQPSRGIESLSSLIRSGDPSVRLCVEYEKPAPYPVSRSIAHETDVANKSPDLQHQFVRARSVKPPGRSLTYLKNCIVLPNAAILTEGGSIIKESCFPYSDRKRILKMFNPWIVENEGEIFINTDGLEIVDKETLYVREHGEMGFFHWMHSVFPRVDVIESQLLPSDCQVLIQRKAKFQIESIALFDFQGRTIVTPPLDRPQFYKELIFPSALVEDGDFWLRPPSVKQFYSALPISVREQPRRIYITRQDAGFRRLTNESAVLLSESKSDLIDFSQNSADMSDHKPSFR